MNYKTHLIGGICFGVTANALLIGNLPVNEIGKMTLTASFVTASAIGSLLPDIDIKGSYISNRAKIASTIVSLFGHRGITHAPIINLLLVMSLLFLTNLIYSPIYEIIVSYSVIGLGCGIFLGHLLLDSLNSKGIPLMYPFSKKRYNLMNIRSGAFGEYMISVAMVVSIVMRYWMS